MADTAAVAAADTAAVLTAGTAAVALLRLPPPPEALFLPYCPLFDAPESIFYILEPLSLS
jgi:hypothetical protein